MRFAVVVLVVALGLADVGTAWADEAPERPLLFEVSGFGGLTLGGRFRLADAPGVGGGFGTGSSVGLADHGSFALTGDFRIDEGSQYEFLYSREATGLSGNSSVPRTNVTVEYFHLGGTLLLDEEQRVQPYLVGGVGVTRFTPGVAGSSDTRFSAHLGVGLRWPLTRHLSLRFEGRGLVTLVNPNTAIFCRSDQSGLLCRIHGSGQTFVQGELLAGMAFAF